MKNSGKTLTIFLSVISVLMISITAIAVFLLMQEVNERKVAEYELEQIRVIEAKLQGDLAEVKKKVLLFEKKTREADEKIESLLEDLELEQGLREEVKKESRQLRESRDILEKEKLDRGAVEQKFRKDLSTAEEQISSLKEQLEGALSQNKETESRHKELENQYQELKGAKEPFDTLFIPPYSSFDLMEMDEDNEDSVELEKIVVSPFKEKDGTPIEKDRGIGRIISIDRETDFIIVDLGEKDGIQKDTVLSIYRGDRHLGDVKVSRVLTEMSAADFIPPLESQEIREDDRVVIRYPNGHTPKEKNWGTGRQ